VSRTASILISLFIVAAVCERVQAQQNNSASQAVTFGVVRSSAVVERAVSSIHLLVESGSVQNLTKSQEILENIPAKITISLSAFRANKSVPVQAKSFSATDQPGDFLSPVSAEESRSQMDLQILLAEHRALQVNNTPLVVTITD
jgi:hypothetical protein